MPPRISRATPHTLRASRVARNFNVGVRMRNNAAASWLPASARSSASAVRKLIDSACSVASMIFMSWRRARGRAMMGLSETTRVALHRHRIMMRAAHQRGGFDAIGKPRRVYHFGHLHEAAIELADRIGNGA